MPTAAKLFHAQYTEDVPTSEVVTLSFPDAQAKFLHDCSQRNKPRTVSDYTRLLNKHFKFTCGVGEVTRKQVMNVTSSLSTTPSEQSHAYVAIRTMMNWCVRHGLIEHSVVPQIKQGSKPRERVLEDTELCEVITQAQKTPFPFGPVIQLLILTGQRRTEVGCMRRSWIHGEYLTFPEGFAKNKREHRFPLSSMAQRVIENIPNTGDLLFPSANDPELPFTTWAWHKARFDKELHGVAHFTLHDLRRTFATVHAKIGTPIHVTEKLLNHVSGTISGVAAVYNRHSYMDEMRGAVEQYDEYLAKLIKL